MLYKKVARRYKRASLNLVHYDFSSYSRRDTSKLDQIRAGFVQTHPIYKRAQKESWDLLSDGSEFRYWAVSKNDGGPLESAPIEDRSSVGALINKVDEYTVDFSTYSSEDPLICHPILFSGDAYYADQATKGSSASDYGSSLKFIQSSSDVPKYIHDIEVRSEAYSGDPRGFTKEVTYNLTEIIEFVPATPPWIHEDNLYEYVER